MQGDSIRLEGFDTPLRGHKTLVVGPQELWLARMQQLASEAIYKGHNVLVIHETTKGTGREYPLLYRRRWDVIFRFRDAFDAQMIATYVQNAPKPCRILWCLPPPAGPAAEIPRALWSRWVKNDITLLGGTEVGVMGACEWECILFPLKCDQVMIERVLSSRGSGIHQMATKLRDHLSEIASSGAALAWTNVEEKDSRGALYWYDPSEGAQVAEDLFTRREASAMLEALSRWAAGGGS